MPLVSDARILSALSLRARVTLKRELQRLCRTHSAAAAFLWTASPHGDRTSRIEAAGDPSTVPRSHLLKGACTANACEQRTLRSEDGEDREVVLLYSRLCTDAPMLVLGLVDCRAPFTDVLTDDMEEAVERLETIIVDQLDPLPASAEPRRSRVSAPRQ